MATNGDVIAALVKSKEALDGQVDGTSGQALDKLMDSIGKIKAELGALEANALSSANYIPATDAFKKATSEGQDFIKSLNELKATFAAIKTVATALDSVIKIASALF